MLVLSFEPLEHHCDSDGSMTRRRNWGPETQTYVSITKHKCQGLISSYRWHLGELQCRLKAESCRTVIQSTEENCRRSSRKVSSVHKWIRVCWQAFRAQLTGYAVNSVKDEVGEESNRYIKDTIPDGSQDRQSAKTPRA